jgi:hypothetical protein
MAVLAGTIGVGSSGSQGASAAAFSWTPGVFESSSSFAAQCANPALRHGSRDGQGLPDRPLAPR